MEFEDATRALAGLAQPTRLRLFRRLIAAGSAGQAAGELAAALGVPNNTLSSHLACLKNAGLIGSRRDGRSIIYSVEIDAVRALLGFLVDDCCGGRPELCAGLVESKVESVPMQPNNEQRS
ncbi:helix-turn-helix transcriptional regulator [Wenzhouxiangella sp. XN79A]|uniref:ArsR/SmtB family transcription factor n=1 Tax=Wenzhouxiangella sp. XN79A TaxID=2724193 RepID=UPI00144AF15F|nr:metalloregulator ArsR/SmtB family transcription factor [Wenzhouxiangella sp. XN79A]NKI36163.1 helix-turn-helix transcriptional regulator [Wenzhouxiangella sp. XN79A]